MDNNTLPGGTPVEQSQVQQAQDRMIAKLSEETGRSVEEIRRDISGLTPVPPSEQVKFTPEVTTKLIDVVEREAPEESISPVIAEEVKEVVTPPVNNAVPPGTPSFLKAAYETAAKANNGESSDTSIADRMAEQRPTTVNNPPQLVQTKSVNPSMMHPLPDAPSQADMELLDKINIDLTHIEITSSNKLQRAIFMDAALRSDAAYQVIPLRSGYSCGMGGLTFLDKDSLRNSNLDPYNERKRLYQITHQKMIDTSVGEMTFSEFLKITAFDDLETLLFGVYCQTYPNATEFTVTCGKCGKPCQIQIHPMQFVKVQDDSVYSYINDVISRKQRPIDLLGQSLVHTHERILLTKSKIIVDIRTPSLQDHLDTLARYNDQTMSTARETFGCMVYIDQVLVPNIQAIKQTGKAIYSKLEDFDEVFRVVCDLKEDGDRLNGAINRREKKYAVTYRIKSIPCSACKEDMGEIPIDVERLLYFQMEESRRQAEAEEMTVSPAIEMEVESEKISPTE